MHCNKWDSHSPSVYSSVRVVRMPPVTVINLPNSGRGWAAKVSRIVVPLKNARSVVFRANLRTVRRRRKDFLIGGAQSETTHGVVSNLYNNL